MRYRLQDIWGIVNWRVHFRRNLIHHEPLCRQGHQERLRRIECQAGIEPVCLILLPENHRHPGVNLGDQSIGLGGQDGEGRVHFALGIVHRAPDPGKGKGLLGLQGNPVGPGSFSFPAQSR